MARVNKNIKKVRVDKYSQGNRISPATLYAMLGFIVVVFAIIAIFSPSNQEKIYNAYQAYGVTTLPEDHPFYQVDYDGGLFSKGVEDYITSGEPTIVVLGFASCGGCQAHITPFATYFESTGVSEFIDRVYYYDVSVDQKGFAEFQGMFPEIPGSTPQIILFMDGEIVAHYFATTENATNATDINRNVRDFYEDALELING